MYSNNFPLRCHHIWGQKCSAYRLYRARATFLCLNLSIKARLDITYVLSTTCRQRPGMVFLPPTLRYWPFDLWYKEVRQRNFASDNCVKEKWLLPQCNAMQSTVLTLQHLIQLPKMHFFTHPSHSSVNGYIQILVLWKVYSKKMVPKYSFWDW